MIAFVPCDGQERGATHSEYPDYTGDCFRTFIHHVMDKKKGQLPIQNILKTSGDCFRIFIHHVMDKKGELLIQNILITPVIAFVLLYSM